LVFSQLSAQADDCPSQWHDVPTTWRREQVCTTCLRFKRTVDVQTTDRIKFSSKVLLLFTGLPVLTLLLIAAVPSHLQDSWGWFRDWLCSSRGRDDRGALPVKPSRRRHARRTSVVATVPRTRTRKSLCSKLCGGKKDESAGYKYRRGGRSGIGGLETHQALSESAMNKCHDILLGQGGLALDASLNSTSLKEVLDTTGQHTKELQAALMRQDQHMAKALRSQAELRAKVDELVRGQARN
jgi:hypothetical protein